MGVLPEIFVASLVSPGGTIADCIADEPDDATFAHDVSSQSRDAHGRWQAGDEADVPALGGRNAFRAKVFSVKDGKAKVGYADSKLPAVEMPAESLPRFFDDLSGRVNVPPGSGDPDVDAVAAGKAEYLGKGDDGIAFAHGDNVVKVDTTVPYQPFNPFHKTPAAAADQLLEQAKTNNKLHDLGVPGVLPQKIVEHGGRTFTIRPKLDIPKTLTAEQLNQVRQSIDAMHEKGYAVGDEIQVGLKDGKAYQYDLGKAHPTKHKDALEDDSDRFGRFSEDMGHERLPLKAHAVKAFADWQDTMQSGYLGTREQNLKYGDRLRRGLIASGVNADEVNRKYKDAADKGRKYKDAADKGVHFERDVSQEARGEHGRWTATGGGGETGQLSNLSDKMESTPVFQAPGDEEKVGVVSERIFGRRLSNKELVNLVGDPPQHDVVIHASGDPRNPNKIFLEITGDDIDAERVVDVDPDGNPRLTNQSISVTKEKRGQGVGTGLFTRQLDGASKLGVTSINCSAGGYGKEAAHTMNGYYTWPLLGFNAKSPTHVPKKFNAPRVSDLIAIPEGRQWWKENGVPLDVSFNTASHSLSRKMLEDYLKERKAHSKDGKATAYFNVTDSAGKFEENDLSPEEIALLESIWDRRAAAFERDVSAQDRDAHGRWTAGGGAAFPADPSSLQFVKNLPGSTGPALVKDAAGNRFVLKTNRGNADHLREEAAADAAYAVLGLTPERSRLYETPNGPVKLSQYLDGDVYHRAPDAARAKAAAQLREGFVADCLLSNWDVVGPNGDNVLVTPAGDAVRIDNGGALRYRAQGRPKGDRFGDAVTEIDTLRDPGVNPATAEIFGSVTDKEIKQQIGDIQAKRDKLMAVLPPKVQPIIGRRLDWLASRYGDPPQTANKAGNKLPWDMTKKEFDHSYAVAILTDKRPTPSGYAEGMKWCQDWSGNKGAPHLMGDGSQIGRNDVVTGYAFFPSKGGEVRKIPSGESPAFVIPSSLVMSPHAYAASLTGNKRIPPAAVPADAPPVKPVAKPAASAVAKISLADDPGSRSAAFDAMKQSTPKRAVYDGYRDWCKSVSPVSFRAYQQEGFHAVNTLLRNPGGKYASGVSIHETGLESDPTEESDLSDPKAQEKIMGLVRSLDTGIARAVVPMDMTVHRGISPYKASGQRLYDDFDAGRLNPRVENGKTTHCEMADPAYASATLNAEGAAGMSNWKDEYGDITPGGLVVHINLKAGQRAACLGALFNMSGDDKMDEEEMLLPRDARLRVLGTERDGDKRHIYAELME